MNVRQATEEDAEDIEDTVMRSFRASYGLSPQGIENILTERFTQEKLVDRIQDPERELFVGETDHLPVAGFAELGPDGALRWLHVHPAARGQGVGTELVETARRESDAEPFTAWVLEGAREGSQFLEKFGLYWTESTKIEIGDEEFSNQVFTPHGEEKDAHEPAVDVPEEVEFEGEERTVQDDPISGTLAPFFTIGQDDDQQQVGFFCSECGTTNVSSDGLERLDCNECENKHRAEFWDPSYL